MSKPTKPLSDLTIGDKIRQGKPFWVGSNRERKACLSAAKFAGVKITTKADTQGFFVIFLDHRQIEMNRK